MHEVDIMRKQLAKGHTIEVVEVSGRSLAIRVDRPKGTSHALYETILLSTDEAKALWLLLRDMTE